ncbi:Na+/H+ antiporter subunit E [Lacimonas salitolerans]|uniref:Na+/H+ antiporter subunit E n=1 Tax=Lacimonas salitolerans TaxID=1323750 RepID=A0ABW4EEF9_9RHOB
MMRRILPHPMLSLLLTIVWLMLVNKVTLGNLILGGTLGILVPIITSAYWPDRAVISHPLRATSYVFLVMWDIVIANIEVARIILFKPNKNIRSRWVTVPLSLKSPEAITVLAGTITMTPGTVSTMLSADGAAILVHCLHTDDPDAVRDQIKTRYESRLKEIFE